MPHLVEPPEGSHLARSVIITHQFKATAGANNFLMLLGSCECGHILSRLAAGKARQQAGGEQEENMRRLPLAHHVALGRR
jgi:hypothetical protein